MSILLAVTKRDGHETNAQSTLPALVTVILTPRSKDAARGMSVRHIFETNAFRRLASADRAPVIEAAVPAIATTDCPKCREKWLADHVNRSQAGE
jgi:hypothetical protein